MSGESAPLLSIRLRFAPVLLAVILALHCAAGMVLFLMRLPFALTAPLALLILASAVLAARAQMLKRGLSFTLPDDGGVWLHRESGGSDGGAGEDAWARVLPGTVLFPAVVWFALAWTEPGGRQRRLRLMLIAAEVEETPDGVQQHGQWRRLRTWLRYRAAAAGGREPDSLSRADGA